MAGVNGVPQQLSGMTGRFSRLRSGKVVLVDPFAVSVDVGVTDPVIIRAAYIRQSEPKVDDTVSVVRQGASWLVVGTSSASGGNSVLNPSFEISGNGGVPPDWTLYNSTDVSISTDVEDPKAVEGTHIIEVAPANTVTAISFTYSSPIAVAQGQVWELSAYAWATYSPGASGQISDPGLFAFWFSNATNLYPTTSSADTTVANVIDLAQSDTPVLLRGNVTVPGAGTAFMRVALRAVLTPYSALQFDWVTARRIS